MTKIIDSDGMPCTLVGGLTKREYYAGLAMQGLIANPGLVDATDQPDMTQEDAINVGMWAVRISDALLKALSPDGGAT